MVMSKIPISKMTLDELRDYASDLYKDGYSRMSIFRLTDGKLSERQIRKIYKKADKNPLLKEWHKENMKRKQSDLNKAVKGRINTLKLQGYSTMVISVDPYLKQKSVVDSIILTILTTSKS